MQTDSCIALHVGSTAAVARPALWDELSDAAVLGGKTWGRAHNRRLKMTRAQVVAEWVSLNVA